MSFHSTKHFLQYLSSLLLAFTLAACGFQIKGNNETGNSLKALHIIGNNRFEDIAAEVRNLAISQGLALNNQSEWSIRISDEDIEKWHASINRSVSKNEYTIRLSVDFQIYHLGHELQPVSLAAEAIFQDNADQITSKDNEEALIIGELRRKIAADILRQTSLITANPPDCSAQHESEATTTPR